MSTYTNYYNAKKPTKSENYDVDIANFNNDLWDEKIFGKQDKIPGKDLSTNDFTNAYKSKLDSLKNYDDTKINSDITNIKQKDTEQDTKLSTLQIENIELKAENESLKEDLKGLPNATVKGENIDIKDSAEMRVLEFKVSGNSRQKGEPTPETPVEVESCGGNVNLFDKNNVTILDAIINSTSKVISSFLGCKTFYIPCQKNKQITISRKEGTRFIVGTTTSSPSLNTVCNQIKINNTGNSITLVTGDNDNYLVVFYYNSGSDILTEQEILDSIKIEQNSKATPYSKYGQGNINIEICNKNKFNKDNIQIGKAWNLSNNTSRAIFVCKVKPNTKYTITFENIDNFEGLHLFEKTNYDDTVLSRNILQITKSTTITTNSETNYIGIQFNKSNVSLSDFTNLKLQIEENDTETQIIEHQSQTYTIPTQQPFRKIGEYEDTFIKKDSKWYERHYIARKILDGTENWKRNFITENIPQYYTNIQNILTDKIISNHFLFGKTHREGNRSYMNSSSQLAVFINPTLNGVTISTLEEWKSWLSTQYNAGTPVYVDYVLETPNDIECTEEQVEILNKLENAKTYKGVTHIYSMDKVSPNMEVTYLKDIDDMVNLKIFGEEATGNGDMLRYVYDKNNNGIVDNAEKVNNHTVEANVPANAVFTDTTYNVATETSNGLMSNTDKTKLNNISKVATSGSYNDLINKPSIPTVNDATLTIQKNGVNISSFSANASSNATANITVPTKISELTNDSGYKTTDNNTTYSLSQDSEDGHKITLTPSIGNPQTIVIPDNNTTYSVATKTDNGLMSSNDKNKLDSIEDKINEVVLYENEEGTTEDIVLSESSDKFKYLEIFFFKHNTLTDSDIFNSSRIYSPNNKKVSLQWSAKEDDDIYQFITSTITILDKRIIRNDEAMFYITINRELAINLGRKEICITKVVGYK